MLRVLLLLLLVLLVLGAAGLLALGAFPPDPRQQEIRRVIPNGQAGRGPLGWPAPREPAYRGVPGNAGGRTRGGPQHPGPPTAPTSRTSPPLLLRAARCRRRRMLRCCKPTCAAWRVSGWPRAPRRAGCRHCATSHRFLARDGVRPDDPTALLDSPRLPRSLPKSLMEPEVDALMQAAAARPGRSGLLARAALEILYATGLRVSELLALPRAALSDDAQVLLVRGKGGKERIVPLSDAARDAAAALGATNPKARWLFPGRDPRQAMTRQGFNLVLKAVALEAGLDPARRAPARAAPFLCQPHAGAWRRPAQPAGAAGAQRHRHHPDLHPRAGRPAASPGGSAPPPGHPGTGQPGPSQSGGRGVEPPAMRHFLDFEKPIAELEGKIEELRHMSEPGGINIADEIGRLTDKADKQLRATYAKLTPWQEDPGSPPPRSPARPGLHRRADHRVHAPGRGPSLRRRRCRWWVALAASMASSVVVLGTERGSGYREPRAAQFRHGPSGRLPQGAAPSGAGRALRPADPDLRRHRRRLPRHRGRGARPGRGDRPQYRGLAWKHRSPSSPASSAKAGRAAPSRSRPGTRC